MSWPWNPGQRSLKVIGTDTDRSAAYDFLLTLYSNHEPISYRFREKKTFPPTVYLTPPLKESPWNWVSTQGVKKLEWWGYQMVKQSSNTTDFE